MSVALVLDFAIHILINMIIYKVKLTSDQYYYAEMILYKQAVISNMFPVIVNGAIHRNLYTENWCLLLWLW